jgi:hypothetical protein
VASNASESRRPLNKRKRKRTGNSSRGASDAEDSDNESTAKDTAYHLRSPLAKRILAANSRKSQLSKLVVVSSKPSSAAVSPNGSSHGRTPTDRAASANGGAVDRDSADDEDEGDGEDSDLDDWANEFEKELV